MILSLQATQILELYHAIIYEYTSYNHDNLFAVISGLPPIVKCHL